MSLDRWSALGLQAAALAHRLSIRMLKRCLRFLMVQLWCGCPTRSLLDVEITSCSYGKQSPEFRKLRQGPRSQNLEDEATASVSTDAISEKTSICIHMLWCSEWQQSARLRQDPDMQDLYLFLKKDNSNSKQKTFAANGRSRRHTFHAQCADACSWQ